MIGQSPFTSTPETLMQNLTIRPMAASEMFLALDWAAAEGLNPGLRDAECFATVDPEGFWLGELGGKGASQSCKSQNENWPLR